MSEQARPGAQLLVSLIAEERRGRPGPARQAALEAARADPERALVHLLDATCAALVAGEARAASRLLDEAGPLVHGHEVWQRRIDACRAWAWTVDRNWYPGDCGAEIVAVDAARPAYPDDVSDDPETRLLEACVRDLDLLLSVRALIEGHVRQIPLAIPGFVEQGRHALQHLNVVLEASGATWSLAWTTLAHADLLRRAGDDAAAEASLENVRKIHAYLRTNGIPDPVGEACASLVEGDWYAAPGSSPEGLGLDLAPSAVPSPFADKRDDDRAAKAYEQAGAMLAGVAEPRANGALALRRAALAWHRSDYETQLAELAASEAAFASAGDVAGSWLTVVHRLIASVAADKVAATRRDAGTRFDLRPRGKVAELVDWAEKDGSASFTSGLGRLLQRVGAQWFAAGEYERADVAYSLAVPLLPRSGAEVTASLLLELAAVDARQQLGLRAATRLRQALATLPPVADAKSERLEWMRQVNVVVDIVNAHMSESATAAGTNVGGLERAMTRLRALLALPGVPEAGSVGVVDAEHIAELARARAADTLEDLLADADLEISKHELIMLTTTAEMARRILDLADPYLSFQRGGQAARAGGVATAKRWYQDALTKVDTLALESSGVPDGTFAVVVLAATDRFDEARARLHELLAAAAPEERAILATLAVRARDYKTAVALFAEMGDDGTERSWLDLLDRAEAALGAVDPDGAVALAEAAVAQFEEQFARLRRDADRVMASDDIKVASLYLTAARAQIARADASGDGEALERAFALSDRARALALAALLADAPGEGIDDATVRRWRQVAAEWQSAHERLYRAYATEAGEEEVAKLIALVADAEDEVVAVEADVEAQAPRALARRVRTEPSVGLRHVQERLPPRAALLEYQVIDRDLLVWAVTAGRAEHALAQRPSGVLARLVHAVHRGCSNGRPGVEADELGELLLGPVGAVLDDCERVIVVPYGRLNGLPFHVLPWNGRPLGETHVVSYLPAASLLERVRVDDPAARARPLVVGDPAFDPGAHPSLRRLPGAAVEAESVARIIRRASAGRRRSHRARDPRRACRLRSGPPRGAWTARRHRTQRLVARARRARRVDSRRPRRPAFRSRSRGPLGL